jgi:DNA-binding transcriptional regulator WhiA
MEFEYRRINKERETTRIELVNVIESNKDRLMDALMLERWQVESETDTEWILKRPLSNH